MITGVKVFLASEQSFTSKVYFTLLPGNAEYLKQPYINVNTTHMLASFNTFINKDVYHENRFTKQQ